jgi:AcrR family transcriptional regulator
VTRSVGQHHGDVPRALIAAALELIEEGEDPGLRAVARRAEVSPAATYHHFVGKDGLLTEVAREGFVALAAAQAEVVGRGADRLERMTAAYVRFGWSHPTHYRVMFAMPPHQRVGASAAALQQVGARTFDTLADCIAEANPTLDADEAGRRALLTWALAHGMVQLGAWQGLPVAPADPDALASAAGQAARAIAEAPPEPRPTPRRPRTRPPRAAATRTRHHEEGDHA